DAGTAPRRAARPVKAPPAKARSLPVAASAEELEATLKFNPFALTTSLRQLFQVDSAAPPLAAPSARQPDEKAREAAPEKRLSEFRRQKVSAIFRTSTGAAAALVGSRVLKEGEVLDGIRIVSISADGVMVEVVKSGD